MAGEGIQRRVAPLKFMAATVKVVALWLFGLAALISLVNSRDEVDLLQKKVRTLESEKRTLETKVRSLESLPCR
jgi:hypothetical protein